MSNANPSFLSKLFGKKPKRAKRVVRKVARTKVAPRVKRDGEASPQWLKIGDVFPDPRNVRERTSFDELDELIQSMKERGFQTSTPLVVTPMTKAEYLKRLDSIPAEDVAWRKASLSDFLKGMPAKFFMLVDGEHRLRAAKAAGLSKVYAVAVKVRDDLDLAARQNAANLSKPRTQREVLNALIRMREGGASYDYAKKNIGKTARWLEPRWKALDLLPAEAAKLIDADISIGEAEALMQVYDYVGKSKFLPTKAEADRWLLGILNDWRGESDKLGGVKPLGFIKKRADTLVKDFQGQTFLAGVSPVPTAAEVEERGAAHLLTGLRDAVYRLAGELSPRFDRWKKDAENRGKGVEDFVRSLSARAAGNVSALLDQLGLADKQLRGLVMRLCSSGQPHAACRAASSGYANPKRKSVSPQRRKGRKVIAKAAKKNPCKAPRAPRAPRGKKSRENPSAKGIVVRPSSKRVRMVGWITSLRIQRLGGRVFDFTPGGSHAGLVQGDTLFILSSTPRGKSVNFPEKLVFAEKGDRVVSISYVDAGKRDYVHNFKSFPKFGGSRGSAMAVVFPLRYDTVRGFVS